MGTALAALVFVLAYGVLAALWGASLLQLRTFLRTTPSIDGEEDLGRYRDLARIQMYAALLVIVLSLGGIAASAVLVRFFGLGSLAVVLPANVVLLLMGLYHKRVEDRVRALPVSETLAAERDRVSATWLAKPFPDF
jgi:hypothetical protein